MGLANHKFFLLFLLYTFSICAYALCLIGAHVTSCLYAVGARPDCTEFTAGGGVATLTLSVCAVLFGLFTCCMMVDQSAVVTSGLSQIDRFHLAHDGAGGTGGSGGAGTGPRGSRAAALAEVFGGDPAREGFRLHWLLPTPIVYVNPEELTGYCFRNVPKPRTTEEMESLL